MEHNVQIHLPIHMSYPALEGMLQEKMVGGYIPPGSERRGGEGAYAQIVDLSIEGGAEGTAGIMLKVRINILKTLLKRDNVLLHVHATLDYDNAAQQLFVRNFKVDSRTSSSFFNAGLEVLANSVAYDQILKKARVPVGEIIAKEKSRIDGMLANGLMPVKGIMVRGQVNSVRVEDIQPQAERISLLLLVQANVEAEINDLAALLAAKPA